MPIYIKMTNIPKYSKEYPIKWILLYILNKKIASIIILNPKILDISWKFFLKSSSEKTSNLWNKLYKFNIFYFYHCI